MKSTTLPDCSAGHHPAFVVALAMLWGWSLPAAADPVTPAFTYQGRLNHNGAPANGTFDLKFELYNVAAGGNPVAGPIDRPAQEIAGGLFSVELEFGGPPVFDGTAYWLGTSARVAGGGDFLPASERVALRTAPYAIHALSAAGVKDGAVTASSLANGAVTGTKLAPFAVGLAQLNAPAAPTAGQVLTFDGANLSWSTPPGGGGGSGPWLTSGAAAYYNAGRVGIGTAAPNHLLSLTGTGPHWTSNGWLGALELPHASAIAWRANGAGQRFGMGHTDGGFYLFRTSSDPGNNATPAIYDFSVDDTGGVHVAGTVNIGGTGTATSRLEVYGQDAIAIYGYQPVITLDDTNADFLLGSGIRIQSVEAQMVFQVQSVYNGTGWPYLTKAKIDAAGLTVYGSIRSENANVSSLTIRGGADLAEPFAMSQGGVEPGSVVVIDAAHPGRLKMSTGAYDRKVAGIVSGANNIKPGISMIQEDALEAGENVALSGRVYVKADASAGPIEPGDLLTTSSAAGRAMKAADHNRAQGAIIGKAMTRLDDGEGMVLVLVTLQ